MHMIPLRFGSRAPYLEFKDEHEFFEALGLLASRKHTRLCWEHNEDNNAWGSEGRIQCYSACTKFPRAFRDRMSAGVGNIDARINCNDYVQYLVSHWGFMPHRNPPYTTEQIDVPDDSALLAKVPAVYQPDFLRGYNI